jgi:hypothetical protein
MEDKGMEDKGMEDKGMEDKGMEDRGTESGVTAAGLVFMFVVAAAMLLIAPAPARAQCYVCGGNPTTCLWDFQCGGSSCTTRCFQGGSCICWTTGSCGMCSVSSSTGAAAANGSEAPVEEVVSDEARATQAVSDLAKTRDLLSAHLAQQLGPRIVLDEAFLAELARANEDAERLVRALFSNERLVAGPLSGRISDPTRPASEFTGELLAEDSEGSFSFSLRFTHHAHLVELQGFIDVVTEHFFVDVTDRQGMTTRFEH